MTSRTRGLYLLAPVLLTLSACSTEGGTDEKSPIAQGAIEFAISELCAEKSDSQCVLVNGESIMLPSTFERAGVEAAVVAEGEGHNAVDLMLTDDGATILHTLTEEAAGGTARLVMKIGDEIMAAVMVAEAVEGKQLQIALAPDDDAKRIVELIQGD